MRHHIAFLLVSLGACKEFEFETDTCLPISSDNEPPWRSEAGDADGPRFIDASIEWLTDDATECRFDLELRMRLREGEGTVSREEISQTILFSPRNHSELPYLFVIDDDAVIERDGDVLDIVVAGCAVELEGLDSRRSALLVKVRDADGLESDAFCARSFAKAGTELPKPFNQEVEDGQGV